MAIPELKPCPFCGSENINLRTAMGETWAFCHGCAASTDMKASPADAEEAWNTRYEKKPRHHVMVVGSGHDRIPLIEAINQIGFDGIIIAEEDNRVSLGLEVHKFELPKACATERFLDRETNAQRCGYSTKRK